MLGLTWLSLHFYTLYSLGIELETALKDSIISLLITAILCWLISHNLYYYKPQSSKFLNLIVWCLFLAFINTLTIALLLPLVTEGHTYAVFINHSLAVRFAVSFLMISLMALISMLWYNQQDKEELELRKNESDKLNKEAELASLREKLQPHFLFNSLNSISALTFSKPAEARKMIHQLSDFLRGTIRIDDKPTTLKSEIEHLKLYLEIEKVRFGHRLTTNIICDEICSDTLVPPMILQPIVENAIKFGLYDTIEEVLITITCKLEDGMLRVSVSNPFDPTTSYPNNGTGFGLSGVRKRLMLFYNINHPLKTEISETEFTTTIFIPQL